MKRIFKTIIMVAVIAIITAPGKAYAGDKLLQFGVKAGLNFTNMSDMGDFGDEFMKTYTGFNAGLLLKLNLPLGFELQPELLYYQAGYTVASDFADLRANFVEGSLRVPVNIQWGIRVWKIKPYIMLSPFVGCSLYQTMNGELGEAFGDFQWNAAPENINRFQYGVGIGAGINVWKFQLGFKWNWNLNNVQKETSDVTSKFTGGELHLAFIF